MADSYIAVRRSFVSLHSYSLHSRVISVAYNVYTAVLVFYANNEAERKFNDATRLDLGQQRKNITYLVP